MINQNKRFLGLIAGVFLIGFAPIFVKGISLDSSSIGALRNFFGGLGFFIFAFSRGEDLLTPLKDKKFLFCLFGASFLFALVLYVWHTSIKLIGAGLGTFLANTQIVYAGLWSFLFFRILPKKTFYLALLLILIGLYALLFSDISQVDNLQLKGIIYGLIAGLSYSLVIVFLRKATWEYGYSPYTFLAWVSLITGIILFLDSDFTHGTWQDLGLSFGLGVGVHFLGWVFISRYFATGSFLVGNLCLILQPVFASLFGAFIYSELWGAYQVFGASLILSGLILNIYISDSSS